DFGATGLLPTEGYHHVTALAELSGALEALGRPSVVDTFQCYPVYIDPGLRVPPRIGDLAHYKVVVWDTGSPPGTTLFDVTSTAVGRGRTRPNQIATYLDAGGVLIVTGVACVRATITPVPTRSPISTALIPGRGNFAA